MPSNTKLTESEKIQLRALKKLHTNVKFYSFPEYGCTVAICEVFKNSLTVKIGISWKSPKENKFRVTVGEFYALNNLLYAGIVVPNNRGYGDFGSMWHTILLKCFNKSAIGVNPY